MYVVWISIPGTNSLQTSKLETKQKSPSKWRYWFTSSFVCWPTNFSFHAKDVWFIFGGELLKRKLLDCGDFLCCWILKEKRQTENFKDKNQATFFTRYFSRKQLKGSCLILILTFLAGSFSFSYFKVKLTDFPTNCIFPSFNCTKNIVLD